MTEALVGLLGSVRLRQPWMGGACLAVVAVLVTSLWGIKFNILIFSAL